MNNSTGNESIQILTMMTKILPFNMCSFSIHQNYPKAFKLWKNLIAFYIKSKLTGNFYIQSILTGNFYIKSKLTGNFYIKSILQHKSMNHLSLLPSQRV